jgi:hypothetical protein
MLVLLKKLVQVGQNLPVRKTKRVPMRQVDLSSLVKQGQMR